MPALRQHEYHSLADIFISVLGNRMPWKHKHVINDSHLLWKASFFTEGLVCMLVCVVDAMRTLHAMKMWNILFVKAKLRSSSWWIRFFFQLRLEENEAATKKFDQITKKRSFTPACQVFHLNANHWKYESCISTSSACWWRCQTFSSPIRKRIGLVLQFIHKAVNTCVWNFCWASKMLVNCILYKFGGCFPLLRVILIILKNYFCMTWFIAGCFFPRIYFAIGLSLSALQWAEWRRTPLVSLNGKGPCCKFWSFFLL